MARSAGLSPLTGRDQEVGLLKDRWEHAKEAVAQLVQLTGEAGIGKSRLVLVLKEFVADDEAGRAASIIEWRCSPHYQDSGLYPATECLERILRLRPADPPRARLDKLAGPPQGPRARRPRAARPVRLAALDPRRRPVPEPGALAPAAEGEDARSPGRLAGRAGEPAAGPVHRRGHALGRPLDPGVPRPAARPAARRPDHDRPDGPARVRPPWPSRANRCQIAINRLTRRQIADLVRRKVGLKDVPAEVVEQLAARTDGVPLFIEEFAKMLEESGYLRGADGEPSLTGSFPLDTIPATLHDLLLSRLDRMPGVKDVAQLGASLGREFSHELIRRRLARSTSRRSAASWAGWSRPRSSSRRGGRPGRRTCSSTP